MKDFKSIHWFLNELPRLQSEGVLEEAAARKLQDYYRKELESTSVRSLLFMILGFLGAFLIAGGVILLTAHNWDMLPKTGRIVLTFTPFVLTAGFACFTLLRRKTRIWTECAALLFTAGIMTLNALISQIYHIDGTIFDFLTLNLLFALALMYLLDSRVLSLLITIALIVFSVSNEGSGGRVYLPLLYTVFWIPFAVHHLRRNSMLTRYAAIAAAIALLCSRDGNAGVLFPLAAAFFFCGGLNLRRTGKTAWFRDPWIQTAFAGTTIYLLILSNSNTFLRSFQWNGTTMILCILFGAALISQICRSPDALNLMQAFFAALPFFLLPLGPEIHRFAGTAFLLLSGILFLIDGFRKSDLLLLNFGQLQLYGLLIVHFLDSRYSILVRSLVFLGAGAVFLVLNYGLAHHFRRKGGVLR